MRALDFIMSATGDLFVLLSAIALICGGLVLITSGTRLKRERVGRRVDLLRCTTGSPDVEAAQGATKTVLTRLELPGLPAPLQREAARWLTKLNVSPLRAAAVVTGCRMLVSAGAAVLALIAADRIAALRVTHALPLLLAAAAGIVGWFAPLIVLRTAAKRRSKAVADGFPDALELLVVCVEAGLALEDGIDRIIGELQRSQPLLAAELALTAADLKILPSRDQALANLADRVDIPVVRSVVTTLSQTMRYGTPLAQAIRAVAAQMRGEALIALQERANRLPALMTVPMMLFIMPTIFLIVGGPAVLRLIDILSR
jgi:tight adherence protein C